MQSHGLLSAWEQRSAASVTVWWNVAEAVYLGLRQRYPSDPVYAGQPAGRKAALCRSLGLMPLCVEWPPSSHITLLEDLCSQPKMLLDLSHLQLWYQGC